MKFKDRVLTDRGRGTHDELHSGADGSAGRPARRSLMSKQPRAKRRWWQYSLRTFLILLTALCLWLGSKTEGVRKQRHTVRLVKSMGGESAFDYEYDEDASAATTPKSPPGPAPLRMLLGDDYFAELVLVRVSSVSDDDVRLVTEQPTIRHLSVTGGITDDGLESICRLARLESLELHQGRVTGAGIAKLSALTRLRSLAINDMSISEEAARQIGRLITLERLSLANTRLTSKLVRHLNRLGKLSTLDLSGTLVGDEGLQDLSPLGQLKLIRLDGSMASPEGIKKLQGALPDAQISSMTFGGGMF
jgi:hypothetical protein